MGVIGIATALRDKPGIWRDKDRVWSNIYRYRRVHLLALPVVAIYLIFSYAPMYGVTLAFRELNYAEGFAASRWVGTRIFEELFSRAEFWRALRNSLIISGLKLAIGFPIPIIMALLLNELRSKLLKKTIQTVTFLPYLLSWAVMGGMLIAALSQSEGFVNGLLRVIGVAPIDFLHSNSWFRQTIVFSYIWYAMGYGMVIYLAGLSMIDDDLYEAAMVDGAGRWAQMRHISLPGLMPVIVTQLIISVGYIMYAGFEQVFVLYSPMVFEKGDILETFIYRIGIGDANYSMATAVGLFQSVIGVALMLTVNQVSRRLADRRVF